MGTRNLGNDAGSGLVGYRTAKQEEAEEAEEEAEEAVELRITSSMVETPG